MAGRPSTLGEEQFLAVYGGIYEHSPWVAQAVWDARPLPDTVDALHAAMKAAVDAAPRERRLALIRAHPDLAGRAAVAGALSTASTAEQAGAGLDRCSPDEFAAFQELNTAYKARFGFPFVIAVRGLDRGGILDTFRRRLANDADTEFDTAIEQIHTIARLRLDALP